MILSAAFQAEAVAREQFHIQHIEVGQYLPSSPEFRTLKCRPSKTFDAATWCERVIHRVDEYGRFDDTLAVLTTEDQRVAFVGRAIEPAHFEVGEIERELKRLSQAYECEPRVLTMPRREGLPDGAIASFCGVSLSVIDADSIDMISRGIAPRIGILEDFLGNYRRSANERLPIYVLGGGAGLTWSATYDGSGKGSLRVNAIDPSRLSLIRPSARMTPDAPARPPADDGSPWIEVPVETDGSARLVPVVVNGAMRLNFTIDSGASDVVVPADVFKALIRTGTIERSDIIGDRKYSLADGSVNTSVAFRFRSLKVGSKVLYDVEGSVTSTEGTPLLGQSFLSRFKSWSMDNQRGLLLLR